MAWWTNYSYPRTRPRRARGGIKARSGRGRFGESWWARRWMEVIEGFDIGARLGRGRTYARQGQVLSIDVGKGRVTARVQGSRAAPYRVDIRVKTLTAAAWGKVTAELGRRAVFAAKLFSGEMPVDIEKVFLAAGVSLFPARSRDLATECSCPDWSNPCKHIAAVYYLIGEEFDRDPFLLFRLRGLDRAALVDRLGKRRRGRRKTARAAAGEAQRAKREPEPLPADPETFWGAAPPAADLFGEVAIPEEPAALPQRLGSFPFWRGDEKFLDVMKRIYAEASALGMEVFLHGR